MGPILIFDKSAFQNLNVDDAVWLDNSYLCNITPLFLTETLADLEKEVGRGRSPEDVVGNLAYKTPDMNSKTNIHHSRLIETELLAGGAVDMTIGRPHVSGGTTIELDGKTGVIFKPSEEEEAMSRWQKGEFIDAERLFAKAWRRSLLLIDLESRYAYFQRFFPLGKPRTLENVKAIVDFYMRGADQESVLRFGLSIVGISMKGQEQVVERWKNSGKPIIHKFAPYFAYMFSVDFFFYLAIAADLISRGRASHKIDLAYLYYLPFCMVFASEDNLHKKIVPFFLRGNQTFISGKELKDDLNKLNTLYSTYPEEVKKRGIVSFASYPPDDKSFLITRLWDKHMNPNWRDGLNKPKIPPGSTISPELKEKLRRFEEDGEIVTDRTHFGITDVDQMLVTRKVHIKKGNWMRFPPEVIDAQKSAKPCSYKDSQCPYVGK